MAASDADRMSPRLARLVSKLPKMCQAAMIHALHDLAVPVHFAEGEADAATAELAQRKKGYMASEGEFELGSFAERSGGTVDRCIHSLL